SARPGRTQDACVGARRIGSLHRLRLPAIPTNTNRAAAISDFLSFFRLSHRARRTTPRSCTNSRVRTWRGGTASLLSQPSQFEMNLARNNRPTLFEKLPNPALARLPWYSRGVKWFVMSNTFRPTLACRTERPSGPGRPRRQTVHADTHCAHSHDPGA